MMHTSKLSVPAGEGVSSTSPSTSVSDHEMARLLEVLSNISLSPAAAHALITVIGMVATPGGPIDDEDAPTVAASPTVVSSDELPPTVTYEDLFRDAPEKAPPGQPLQYHIPRPGSQSPFFAVTRGLAVGVFSGWSATSPLVTGVPRAIYCKYSTETAAICAMESAFAAGGVHMNA